MTKSHRESLSRDERRLIDRGGLLPRDMRQFLKREEVRLRLFAEARLRELTAIVEGYEKGTLTWEQVDKQWEAYEDRWNEGTPLTTNHKLWVELENRSYEEIGIKPTREFEDQVKRLKRQYEKGLAENEERSR